MYERNIGETFEDYQVRICKLKEDKSLTWQDVADIINKEFDCDFSESKYRKFFTAFMLGYGAKEKESAKTVGVFDEYEQKKLDIQKEREKLYATKLEYNRAVRQNSRFEMFYENVEKEEKKLPLPENFQYIAPSESDKEYVLAIADIHAGSRFNGTNNSYSLEICEQRFQTLLNESVKYIIQNNIKNINILSLGDEIQGLLRISDLKLNETSVVESVVFIRRLLAKFFNSLSTYCRVKCYYVAKSNHTQIRPLGTKASELAYEDISRLIVTYIDDVLADNPNVEIIYDFNKDYLAFNLFGFKCVCLHGHTVQNIMTISRDISQNHRVMYDYVFLAHSHSSKEIITAEGFKHNIETLVAPSFIGSCPYSDSLLVGSKAACKIYVFDEIRGHTDSHTIILN